MDRETREKIEDMIADYVHCIDDDRLEEWPDFFTADCFYQVISRAEVRLRVWERGAGITLACGSGACAAVVAGVRKGLLERRVAVHLDGGALEIEWRENGNVCMTGPASHVFEGRLSPKFLAEVVR